MSNYNNYNNGNSGKNSGNRGNSGQNRRVEFEIIERLGTLVNFDNGWTRELNVVIWNGGQPKYDIRDWDPDHRRMTKGIRLYEDEAQNLYRILGRKFGPKDTRRSYSNASNDAQGSGSGISDTDGYFEDFEGPDDPECSGEDGDAEEFGDSVNEGYAGSSMNDAGEGSADAASLS